MSPSPRDTDEYRPPADAPGAPWTASAPARVDIAGLSDRGRVRSNNEDCYLVARFERIRPPVPKPATLGCLCASLCKRYSGQRP